MYFNLSFVVLSDKIPGVTYKTTQVSNYLSVKDEELDPYVPDENLRVPDDLTIPPNKKQYNVILKTAKFLATQGKDISNMASKPINNRWIRTGSQPH